MSKLADRIRGAGRVEPAPLGFAAAAARPPRPTMLCLLRLSANEANKIGEAAAKDADAVVIDEAAPGKLKDQIVKAGELPVGVRIAAASRQDVASCRQAGVDFVVLQPDSMAEALLEDNIGVVIALTTVLDDTDLRQLGEIGLAALIVPAPQAPLTVERLLALRRIASLAHAPLLTDVSADIEPSQLRLLRESGVVGIIIGAQSLGKLSSLRERVASLPPRGRKRDERADALLPAPALAGDHEHDYEEDE
jgi:hypothetical protein